MRKGISLLACSLMCCGDMLASSQENIDNETAPLIQPEPSKKDLSLIKVYTTLNPRDEREQERVRGVSEYFVNNPDELDGVLQKIRQSCSCFSVSKPTMQSNIFACDVKIKVAEKKIHGLESRLGIFESTNLDLQNEVKELDDKISSASQEQKDEISKLREELEDKAKVIESLTSKQSEMEKTISDLQSKLQEQQDLQSKMMSLFEERLKSLEEKSKTPQVQPEPEIDVPEGLTQDIELMKEGLVRLGDELKKLGEAKLDKKRFDSLAKSFTAFRTYIKALISIEEERNSEGFESALEMVQQDEESKKTKK